MPDAADGAFHLWKDEDGEAAALLLASLAEQGDGFEADRESFPQILAQLLAGKTVRRAWQTHPRLAILGPVEARMQSADRLILGGFNEGNWPPRPEIDPWTNAEMRRAAGPQPHNWRTGRARMMSDGGLRARGDPDPRASRRGRRHNAKPAAAAVRRSGRGAGITAAVDRGQVWRDQMLALLPVPPMTPLPRPCPTPPARGREASGPRSTTGSPILQPLCRSSRPSSEGRSRQADRCRAAGQYRYDSLAAFLRAFWPGHSTTPLPSFWPWAAPNSRSVAASHHPPFGGRPLRRSPPGLSRPNPAAVPVFWKAMPRSPASLPLTRRRAKSPLPRGRTGSTGWPKAGRPRLQDRTGLRQAQAGAAGHSLSRRRSPRMAGSRIAAADVDAMNIGKPGRGEPGKQTDVRPDDWSADDDRAMLARLAADFDSIDPHASRPTRP